MRKNKGFTLVELLIVTGIIGILATVVITVINPLGQRKAAKIARIKSDLAKISSVAESHAARYGEFNAYDSDGDGVNDVTASSSADCWRIWNLGETARQSSILKDPNQVSYAIITCTATAVCVQGTIDGAVTYKYDSSTGEITNAAC